MLLAVQAEISSGVWDRSVARCDRLAGGISNAKETGRCVDEVQRAHDSCRFLVEFMSCLPPLRCKTYVRDLPPLSNRMAVRLGVWRAVRRPPAPLGVIRSQHGAAPCGKALACFAESPEFPNQRWVEPSHRGFVVKNLQCFLRAKSCAVRPVFD